MWGMLAPLLAYAGSQPDSTADGSRFTLHPVITEVLYAVPTYEGDANRDGTRQAVGDEFVELMNPHDRPIQLAGYTLTDRNPPDRGQVRFRFPSLELAPGEVVVVFNGFGCTWRGPVGDDRRAPPGRHDLFHDAWVFTMRSPSELTGFSNAGDWVLLRDPSGNPVSCIRWGRMAEIPPVPESMLHEAPAVFSQSVVLGADGAYHPHIDLQGPARYSPGKVPSPPRSAREEHAPAAHEKAPGRNPGA